MNLAQQGNPLDTAAHTSRQSTDPFQQGLDNLGPVMGNGVVGAGQAPWINGHTVVPIHRQRTMWGVGHVVRIFRQHRLNGRVNAKVRGEQIEHQRPRAVHDRLHHRLDGLAIDLPTILRRLQQGEKWHLQGVTQLPCRVFRHLRLQVAQG